MKLCADCGVLQPLDKFSRQAKSKDGRYPYCKTCTSTRHKAAYAARGARSWKGDKTCSWCGMLKPRSDYLKDENGKVHARCVTCETEVAHREAAGERRCSACKEWKKFADFHPSKLAGKHVTCKKCTNDYYWSDINRARARNLKRHYGITLVQYDELLKIQRHVCPICLKELVSGDYSNPVDHAHCGVHRGKIRAIVHNDCNRFVLWTHEDSRQLRAAADLIDHPLTDWMVPENMINAYERKVK